VPSFFYPLSTTLLFSYPPLLATPLHSKAIQDPDFEAVIAPVMEIENEMQEEKF
jgi:hypothetical protein